VAGALFIASAAQAVTSSQSSVTRGFGFAYDPAQEITLVGTVKASVSQPAPGSPAGSHLLISSGGRVVDAHLGPFLSKENREDLKPGQLVQITGVNEKAHGKTILLVRQLIFSGRQVTVRNERGFLVRNLGSPRKIRDGKPTTFGGTQ
jgi:hypothetical protein